MILSAYMYDSFFSNVPVNQFFLDLQQTAVSVKYELKNHHVATFSLALDTTITQGQKIRIYEEQDETNLIFSGYVFSISPVLDRANSLLQIICYSEKHFLSRRIVLGDQMLTGNVSDLITKLIMEYNSNGDSWVSDCDAIVMDIEAKIGASYYDLINDVCDGAGADWDVLNGVVKIKTTIGIDRTYGVDFQEIVFSENESNVSGIEVMVEANGANVVVAKNADSGLTQIFPSPLPVVVKSVIFKEFKETDLAVAAEKYLATISTTNYKLQLEQGAVNAAVGDKIKLRVEGFGVYDFVGSVYVTGKTVEFTNGVKVETIEVSETTAEIRNFGGAIRKIQADVKRLQVS